MSLRTEVLPNTPTRKRARGVSVARRATDWLALTKPRMVVMILVTTCVGFVLGSSGAPDPLRLLHTLLGTALAAGGALALNQFLERDLDAKMERTRLRPLPAGRLEPAGALRFGAVVTAAGLGYLTLTVNAVCGLVTAATVVEPDGRSTGRHIVSNCLALLATGLLPTLIGLAGPVYFFGAIALGTGLLGCGIVLALSRSAADARRLVFASLVYLPALLVLMTLNKVPL